MSKEIRLKGNKKDNVYSVEKGYGYWDPEMVKSLYGTDSEISLKSGGWNRRRLEESDEYSKRNVLIIKVDTPEFGTYRVDIRIAAVKFSVENMTLFAGRRNIIDNSVNITSQDNTVGEVYQKTIYQAITPYIPALASKRCNDKNLFLSITGIGCEADNLDIKITVTKEDVPVIWVAGDSTLTDQNAGIPYYPYGSCCGWAQTISRYVEGAAVCNLAHSGMTSNCFKDDGHYDIAKEMMKPGDVFIIQFGHNDQKRRNLSAFKGYKDNIKKYVEEVRELGAVPVICSPISRIPARLSDEKSYSLLKSYSDACREVAEELGVLFINLHDYTFDKWVQCADEAPNFFMKGDITHTNEYGALLIADYFVEELKKLLIIPEIDKKNIYGMFSGMYNKKVINPESDTKELPKEIPGPDIFSIDLPFVDIEGISEIDAVRKAFKYGLLDPCVLYLHPYAVMPRAQLLMVMFKAFRIAGKRPYLNEFKDVFFDEWDSGYVQALVEENLIDDSTVKNCENEKLFRPDDALTYDEFASFVIRFMEKDKSKRNISIKDCRKRAEQLGIIVVKDSSFDQRKATELTSKEKYQIAGNEFISRGEVYAALARFMDIVGGVTKDLPSDAEIHPVH